MIWWEIMKHIKSVGWFNPLKFYLCLEEHDFRYILALIFPSEVVLITAAKTCQGRNINSMPEMEPVPVTGRSGPVPIWISDRLVWSGLTGLDRYRYRSWKIRTGSISAVCYKRQMRQNVFAEGVYSQWTVYVAWDISPVQYVYTTPVVLYSSYTVKYHMIE